MSLGTVKQERIGHYIVDLRKQLSKASGELEKAKKAVAHTTKENTILEHNIEALTMKVKQADEQKKRHEAHLDLFNQVQAKRQKAEEINIAIFRMCKQRVSDMSYFFLSYNVQFRNENLKQESARHKLDKEHYQKIAKNYRKHIPSMLKLIDDLAFEAGQLLSSSIKKRVEHYAKQDIRRQLLETTMSSARADSDDDMADEVERLITSGIRVPTVERAKTVHVRIDKEQRQKMVRRPKHSLEETEKLFKKRLDSKLNNNINQPQSEVIGGHRTIHGVKGPSVREQQAGMSNVKERVARMKRETAVNAEPSDDLPLLQPAEKSDFSLLLTPQCRKRKLEEDFKLSPSPRKSLSPLTDTDEDALTIVITEEEPEAACSLNSPNYSNPGIDIKATLSPDTRSCPLAQSKLPSSPLKVQRGLSSESSDSANKLRREKPQELERTSAELECALEVCVLPAQGLCVQLGALIRILQINRPQLNKDSAFDLPAEKVKLATEISVHIEKLSLEIVERLSNHFAGKTLDADCLIKRYPSIITCLDRARTVFIFLQERKEEAKSFVILQNCLTTLLRSMQPFSQNPFPPM